MENTCSRYNKNIFYAHILIQITETKLQCDKTIQELLVTTSGAALDTEVGEYGVSVVSRCGEGLVGKIVNACKKN